MYHDVPALSHDDPHKCVSRKMVSSERCTSLGRRSREKGGKGVPPVKKLMKRYERLVESIGVDNVKTSMWGDLRSSMAKHLGVDSMRKRSDEITEDRNYSFTNLKDLRSEASTRQLLSQNWTDAFQLANNDGEKREEIPQAENYDTGSLHFAFSEDLFFRDSEGYVNCEDDDTVSVSSEGSSFLDLFKQASRAIYEDDDAVSVSSEGSSLVDLFHRASRALASVDPNDSFTNSSKNIPWGEMLDLDPITAGPTPTGMEIIQQLDVVLSAPCFDKQLTLPSRVDSPPTLHSNEKATIVLPSGEVDKIDCSVNKINLIEDCSSAFELKRVKTIRFADEHGLPMETVYMLEGPDDPAAVGRVVVLLLKPEVRKFEFIHAEYRLNSRTSVSNLLEQLPGMASNEILTAQRYSSLFRSREGCSEELIGALSLQDCCLDKNEVIIGVMGGYSGQDIVNCALPLIYNDKISKAVSSFRLMMQPINTCDSYQPTCCVASISFYR